ncbi:DUF418 domain-containing protein [Bacillus suaedaesalsae]|uniref:DUF418 domain-containing protein n=1 Tax=Bacillus suaedaesalsae TaxID=2810349 RepID=A0ABS2DGI0_9BACI|nr:DUF418 domain-containing protein [Bacillus suaedaesalsae]MBM6617130.1 DUF418 domain-containing protein [Bacillus suaedaesalsae]
MMNTNHTPISEKERIHSLDVIRGFALLGIFLVNMSSFHSPELYKGLFEKVGGIDQVIINSIDFFAQASFYTLFSFLFGYGMVIFLDRAKEKELKYNTLFIRRLIVLLVIGMLHAFLIWHGDILITYGIIGFIVLLFYKAKSKTLLTSGLFILFIPAILLSALLFIATLVSPDTVIPRDTEMYNQSIEIYSSGTYLDITKQRIEDWYSVNNLENAFFLITSILPLFLLGAYVAKEKWFSHVSLHKKSILIMWAISLVVAVPVKLLPFFITENLGSEFLQDSIGGPAMALFYGTSIVLLVEKKLWRRILQPFSYVGRLSLTNYLLQSIVCTLIFYSYGLGYYGQFSHVEGLLLTFGIYILQIIMSYFWLKYFNYGPMEWGWRSLTYGKFQPLRRELHS